MNKFSFYTVKKLNIIFIMQVTHSMLLDLKKVYV